MWLQVTITTADWCFGLWNGMTPQKKKKKKKEKENDVKLLATRRLGQCPTTTYSSFTLYLFLSSMDKLLAAP